MRVSDDFMQAVVNDETYKTRKVTDGEVCESLRAREVLELAARCAHTCGDPGIQFDTTINEWHTCPNSGRINASNPCSEYMHLDNSACNLASINLLKFLGHDGAFAVEDFLHVVDVLITAQDILIDNSRYPTSKIEKCARDYRQVGLGYANLGALLMSLGLPYDSPEGRQWASAVSALMTGQAYLTSAQLAMSLEPFRGHKRNRVPMLKVVDKHILALEERELSAVPAHLLDLAKQVWTEAIAKGAKSGFRNSQVSVIAPTGTIAFMMDCDTTGIEPDLALVKYKKLAGGGMLKIVNGSVPRGLKTLGYSHDEIERICAYIDQHDNIEGAPHLKQEHLAVFDCAFKPRGGQRSIHYSGHLNMMAAVQPFVSGAISKTVNIPNETAAEEIFNIYVQAWRQGLKAVALYRDGSKRTQPLTTSERTQDKSQFLPKRRRLPDERQAVTHKFSVSGLEGYLTVGLYEDGTPGEIFLLVAKEGSTLSGIMDAFATAVSIALQHGVPLATLVRKFTYMRFEPSGFTTNKEIPLAQSIVDYVFRWLAVRFLSAAERIELGVRVAADQNSNGNSELEYAPQQLDLSGLAATFLNQADAPPCIRCGSSLMVRQAGCYYCLNCGSQGGCG
ncbi:MAG: hypothetical protein DCC75_10070 [Proteobacteria bacterium]|nr:MAG: hypothetical protein DCC75_10070 [Pseudomonadota bacterium]